MTNKIQVLIVDDNPIIRLASRVMLDVTSDIEVVAEAVDGREAVAHAAQAEPDVILMDLMMPVMNGIEASRRVLAHRREVQIVAFTSLEVGDMVRSAVRAGVRGYLHKPASPEELQQAVRDVHGGELFLPDELVRELPSALDES